MNGGPDTGTGAAAPHPSFRGRRHGRRLRPSFRALLSDRLPEVAIDPDSLPTSVDPRGLFGQAVTACWLEIGFGAGEHLAWQAERNPDVGIVGCEPFMNGVASLLRHMAERDVENVRILPDDVRPFLDRLPDGAFERIFVLFPDPWPKRRHADRRIVQWSTIETFHRLLRPGGELRLATDDPAYQRWMLTRATAHPGLRWTARRPADWRHRPDDWPPTRYEAKAIEAGRTPVYMRFTRL